MRGLVMIVMALDHVRDFLGNAHFDATDLAQTTAPVFFTRWITHFCAPTFFLLAGVSAYLSIQSGRRTVGAAARFLVVRGLALVVLEQTALRCLGWYFHFDYHFMNAGVLYGLRVRRRNLADLGPGHLLGRRPARQPAELRLLAARRPRDLARRGRRPVRGLPLVRRAATAPGLIGCRGFSVLAFPRSSVNLGDRTLPTLPHTAAGLPS